MTSIEAFAAKNAELIKRLRPLAAADAEVLKGMGLGRKQWRAVLACKDIQSYLRIDDVSKEVYFLGYVAAQFNVDECVHISLAVGLKDKVHIIEGDTRLDRPSVYNATRDLGRSLANSLEPAVRDKLKVCLERLIPAIPHGDAKEDRGLHMSLFNKSPTGLAPGAEDVKYLQKLFADGVALQFDLADIKVVKGSRCNDMSTGGLYYLACGMSQNMATLCNLIKERFSDFIKGYAPHVSLELWGVAGCRHAQQKLGEGADAKYWYADYLRWGMGTGVFEKCLVDGKFDIARYMYVRTHETFNDADKQKCGETIELMNRFSLDEICKYTDMVDGYTQFGCIPAEQRLHDMDSPVYKFFATAPSHAGVDCAQLRIRNCAAAAGKCPRWYPGTEFTLPEVDVQSRIVEYIAQHANGSVVDIYHVSRSCPRVLQKLIRL